MNKWKTYLLFIFIFNFAQSFYPQIKIHKHITLEDGLVQGQITSLYQDSKGFVWIGTLGGLSIWDGVNFKNLNTYDGLPSLQIMDIKETSDGSIYLAAYGSGVLKINNAQLDTINTSNGLHENNVTKILEYNSEIYFLGNNGNISKLADKIFEHYSDQINFPQYDIWDAQFSDNGVLYCATQNGLVIVKNDSLTILDKSNGLAADLIWSILSVGDSIIYVGTNFGINKIKDGKITLLKDNVAVYKIHKTQNDLIYFATNNGIFIESKNNLYNLNKNNGLISNDLWTLTEDVNGFIYLGTNGNGISVYDPKEYFTNFSKDFGLLDEKIISITEDNFGNQYWGSKSGLLKIVDYKVNTFIKGENLRSSIIDVIYKKENGEILVGTKSGLKTIKNNSLVNYVNDPQVNENEIFSITVGVKSEIYLGTRFGVFSIFKNEVKRLSQFDSITSNFIMSILAVDSNKIYFGSFDKGLFILENDSLKNLTKNNGLSENIINCLEPMGEGKILIGTQNGLNILWNDIVIDTIDMRKGLSNNVIADINFDKNGRLFISTNKGLNILDNIYKSPFSVRTLTQKDGLIYDNCIKNASYIDKFGNLLIGTSKGVSLYKPNKDEINKIPPKIHLSGLEIFNEPYSLSELSKTHKLNYNQNYIKFFYTGINLSSPHKIKYQYKLTGVDNDWVESNENSIQYTSLDKGNYNFKVKARNEWGYWSEPVSLAFTINPAWWETWWFRLIVISSLGFLLWLAFQYRLNYLLKLERLRTKIASDLHDEVGSLLTQISINVDSLSYTKDEEKRKEKSNFIRAKSSEVINMMSDVIWSIDSRNDNMESLVDRIHNFAQNFLSQKDIVLYFTSDIEDNQKLLKIDFRQNVIMIVKEAINNAVKYSECSQIDVNISYKSNLFELIVKDYGRGFDIENVKIGNGLKNIKMRSETIGGKIEFMSQQGFSVKFTKAKL